MAEMHTVFIETNLETRLALLLHKDDHVSAFKDKFCKEHVQCFPNFGEITVSALKVNREDHYYHLSDSMILGKAFEGSERFVFVDVASVEEKRDPTHKEVLQIQAAEEKTKKRKMKSSANAEKSRNKLAVVSNQSALVDESKEAVEREGNIDMDLNEAMKQDLAKGETNTASADIVMINQENDLEKGDADNHLPTAELYQTTDTENEGFIDNVDATSEGEKVTNTFVEAIQNDNGKVDNGDEAKVVKLRKKTKSRKEKSVPKET